MTRLAKPRQQLKSSYEVVVIGSGYGGGIAASRMARAGRKVCVLERGKEIRPGEYPNTAVQLLKQVQTHLPDIRLGSPTAMFDIRYNHDINVVVGCGLGGTSLINAGVALRPDPRVFEDEHWPAEIRTDVELERYFDIAESMLKPQTYPDHYPRLPRTDAVQRCAESLQKPFALAPIFVNFQQYENGRNQFGVEQSPCVNCGDCMSGCNYGAKNTVLMNYLPDAANNGAEIFTEISVRQIEQRGERWVVNCVDSESGSEGNGSFTIEADVVVLAAGTLGSTEILLRSAEAGLRVSERLGSRFSGNGDMVGIAYNTDHEIRLVGMGEHAVDQEKPVGPTTTELIDLRDDNDVKESITLIAASMPGGIASFLPPLLAAAAKLTGTDTDHSWNHKLRKLARIVQSKLFGARTGATLNTLDCLTMVHDDAAGQMYLDKDRLHIQWVNAGEQSTLKNGSATIARVASILGGTFVPNPVWNEFTDHSLVTGHPLGGCPMSDNSKYGVVNHKGQLYDGRTPTSVHRGLYVMDGAVVPVSLGVNPAFTIAALAERSCYKLAQDYGWIISYA